MESHTISEIIKDTPQWTAKIIVAEKCSTKISQNAVPYQPMLFMDMEGNTIRATIYERHISPLANTLKQGRTYLVSNANVKDVPVQYRKHPGELQWSLTGACNIIEIEEDHLDLVFSRITLNPFSGLQLLKNREIPTTTIGMAIAAHPSRPGPSKTGQDYMIRDIIIMDKSFETINLRLWASYATAEGQEIANSIDKIPIIVTKHVFVTTFEGLGVSTTHNTCIYIDTPFEEVIAYKKWIADNNAAITEIKALRIYLTLKRIEANEDDVARPIKDTIEMPIKQHCWIKATATVRRTTAPYWYMSCSTCFTAATETIAGRNFSCRYCTQTNVTATPRARAEIDLYDSTGTITASVMGRPAEDFLNATASKLMGLAYTAMNPTDLIRLDITKDYLFYIKAVAGRQSYSHAPKEFEIVALDEYDPQKHTNITAEIIADELQTPHASTTPLATTNLAELSPPAKRNLYEDGASSATKKKLLSKMD